MANDADVSQIDKEFTESDSFDKQSFYSVQETEEETYYADSFHIPFFNFINNKRIAQIIER